MDQVFLGRSLLVIWLGHFLKNDILLLQDGRAGLLGSDRQMH